MRGYLVVDHGSRRAESNRQLEDMARRVRHLRPEDAVEHAHMEITEPNIATGIDRLVAAGAEEVVVLLYFLSDGRHVSDDVPALVATAADRHSGLRWHIGRALGPHDTLAALMLERAED